MTNYIIVNGELYHHGIKGQKWGFRRYQNDDGTLTEAGRKRYSKEAAKYDRKANNSFSKKRQAKFKQKAADARKELRRDSLVKANKAKAEKKAIEEAKKKAIDSGDVNEILKYKSQMSAQELSDAYNRVSSIKNLEKMMDKPVDNMSAETTKKGESKAKQYISDAAKKVLWDTSVDVAAQVVKTLLTGKANDMLNENRADGKEYEQYVFTNNKRK